MKRILISLLLIGFACFAVKTSNNPFSDVMSLVALFGGGFMLGLSLVLFAWEFGEWFYWYRFETRWRREKLPFKHYLKELWKRTV